MRSARRNARLAAFCNSALSIVLFVVVAISSAGAQPATPGNPPAPQAATFPDIVFADPASTTLSPNGDDQFEFEAALKNAGSALGTPAFNVLGKCTAGELTITPAGNPTTPAGSPPA